MAFQRVAGGRAGDAAEIGYFACDELVVSAPAIRFPRGITGHSDRPAFGDEIGMPPALVAIGGFGLGQRTGAFENIAQQLRPARFVADLTMDIVFGAGNRPQLGPHGKREENQRRYDHRAVQGNDPGHGPECTRNRDSRQFFMGRRAPRGTDR